MGIINSKHTKMKTFQFLLTFFFSLLCTQLLAQCGDNVCDPLTEDYCSCVVDCPCTVTATDIVWVSGYDTGALAISPDPVAYCTDEVNTGGTNGTPEEIFVPFAPLAQLPCILNWDFSSNFGTTYNSTDPVSPATNVDDGTIGLIGLTDQDINASGGVITLTFTDPSGNGCTVNKILDLAMTITSANVPFPGTAAALCPPLPCTSPSATFVSFDCTAPSIEIDVTDIGSPTPGSQSYTWTVQDEFGNVTATVPVNSTGIFTFPIPDNDQVYDILASDGITAACDIGFFNNGNLYGQCRVPGMGCTDIILEGDFEISPTVAWTESSTDNAGVATGFAVVDPTAALAGTNGAWFGGYGNAAIGAGPPFTTTMSQPITIAAGSSNTIYFWAFAPLIQPADVLTIDIDGTAITAVDANGLAPLSNNALNWREYSATIPAALADGASHTLTISLVEQGAVAGPNGFFQTNFFVDDVMVESCSSTPCPPDYAGANALSGNEPGMEDYETDGGIESTQVIQSGAQVDYDAGPASSGIDLNDNFEVQAGAEFDAFIDGCNNGMGGNQLQGTVAYEQRRIAVSKEDNNARSFKQNHASRMKANSNTKQKRLIVE